MKLITGANGFLGSACRRIEPNATYFTRKEFDLLTGAIPEIHGIDTIIHSADYYPGIEYTSAHPEEVYRKNVEIYRNLFAFAHANRIPKIVTIGTTACYPVTDEPLREEMFAAVPHDRLNQRMLGYARSRFELLNIAQAHPSIKHSHLILPNLYGPGDKFEPGRSHLLSSWVRDFSQMKEEGREVVLWGSPSAQREFMYIDDAASYLFHLADQDTPAILNVGHSLAPTYETLAQEILRAIGFDTPITWDEGKKNPRLKEIMDTTRLQAYGPLPPTTPFKQGIDVTVEYFRSL
jgi:GDP-L-fucose synthase